MAVFPEAEWLKVFHEKLNSDERYADIAQKWEGSIAFVIEADETLPEQVVFFLDLWHGKCRGYEIAKDAASIAPDFVLRAKYANFARVLKGELDPMQAMLTRKLDVKGSMAVMMRSIPTVLDFVRCAREITTSSL